MFIELHEVGNSNVYINVDKISYVSPVTEEYRKRSPFVPQEANSMVVLDGDSLDRYLWVEDKYNVIANNIDMLT